MQCEASAGGCMINGNESDEPYVTIPNSEIPRQVLVENEAYHNWYSTEWTQYFLPEV